MARLAYGHLETALIFSLSLGLASLNSAWATTPKNAVQSKKKRQPAQATAQTCSPPRDMPAPLVAGLQSALTSGQVDSRREGIRQLLGWVRTSQTFTGIAWDRLSQFDYDPNATGSITHAENPLRIRVLIGREPFHDIPNLLSTVRHELVHFQQHQNQAEALNKGWGWQEVNAYLWELENAEATGLDQAGCQSTLPDGSPNTTHGLARTIDGLFRALQRMSNDLNSRHERVSPEEQQQLQRRIYCALLPDARIQIAQRLMPGLQLQDLRGPAAVSCGR